jgi:glycosyltransferase involved in cell wall biosynthesis
MYTLKVLVAQLGARRHYLEPIFFHNSGLLDSFYTDFYVGNNGLAQLLRQTRLYRHFPNLLKKGLERYEIALEGAKIIHFPILGYQYAKRLKQASPEELSSIFIWIGQEFCHRIIRRGLGDSNVIYGFNGASLELFEYAKPRGVRCVLDQTLAERSLVYKLLLEEERYWPGWSSSPFKISDGDLELAQREQQEQHLSDHIICGSEFVKASLVEKAIDRGKISVVPLGRLKGEQVLQVPASRETPRQRGDGLRILFAGTVELRKGIPYLLNALRRIRGKFPFVCKAAGTLAIQSHIVTEYSDVCDFTGRVPRSQMAELYAWADVFVLPSICEGSAMVVYEAMGWNLPVITTHNSGSVVRDKIDGFVVPIRSAEAIAAKLSSIYTGEYSSKSLTCTQEYLEEVYRNAEGILKDSLLEVRSD